jgi:hypothetical protein
MPSMSLSKNKIQKALRALLAVLMVSLPGIAFAVVAVPKPQKFSEVISLGISVVQGIIGLGWVFLVAGFIYGAYKFLANFDDEKAREEDKRLLVWSLIGTAVLLGIYGILIMLHNSTSNAAFGIPQLSPPAPVVPPGS